MLRKLLKKHYWKTILGIPLSVYIFSWLCFYLYSVSVPRHFDMISVKPELCDRLKGCIFDESEISPFYFKDVSVKYEPTLKFSIIKFNALNKETGKTEEYEYIIRTEDITSYTNIIDDPEINKQNK